LKWLISSIEFCLEPDFEVRKELMSRYNRLYTENVYTVGGIIGRYGLALAKRFKNVPVGSPPFFYQWTWGNVQPDQIWVSPDEQIEQVLPGTIPVPSDYGE
jgi:peptide/nickel transport system substrate-binding protein